MDVEETNMTCKKRVYGSGTWSSFHPRRCARKAVKDGYCKQHHPDAEKARKAKTNERYEAKMANSPWRKLEKANARIKELESEVERLKIAATQDGNNVEG